MTNKGRPLAPWETPPGDASRNRPRPVGVDGRERGEDEDACEREHRDRLFRVGLDEIVGGRLLGAGGSADTGFASSLCAMSVSCGASAGSEAAALSPVLPRSISSRGSSGRWSSADFWPFSEGMGCSSLSRLALLGRDLTIKPAQFTLRFFEVSLAPFWRIFPGAVYIEGRHRHRGSKRGGLSPRAFPGRPARGARRILSKILSRRPAHAACAGRMFTSRRSHDIASAMRIPVARHRRDFARRRIEP